MRWRTAALVIGTSLGLASSAAFGVEDIGVTTIIKNHVVGRMAGGGGGGGATAGPAQKLGKGDRVFQNETIETGDESHAQIMFRDETVLTVGPTSQFVLDSFAYNPDTGAGNMVLDTAKGAFRFITGNQAKNQYKIKTPVATMGIRGTIVQWGYNNGKLLVLLQEGGTQICITPDNCQILDQPGTYLVTNGSQFSGIRQYKGKGGEVTFDQANLDLLNMFLGPRGQFTENPVRGPKAPIGTNGFPPLLTGSGSMPPGLNSGSLPSGLAKNRDPGTFLPPGRQ